jgi:hypothetical protein
MRRRWWFILVVTLIFLTAVGLAIPWVRWFRSPRALPNPRSVPGGDAEIALLANPTSYETWDNFVWGVKRAEMAVNASGLEVDDSQAFPQRTTTVPEIVVRRKGYDGSLRIRWYKVTDDATQEGWVKALAARNPAPLAVVGGWSSDRAKELADAMRDTRWPDERPLLFLCTATADKVDPEEDNPAGSPGPNLISVYDRSFRFCFTNRQMADAVTDFVLSDPTLRPGPVGTPELGAVPAAAAGPWAALTALACGKLRHCPPLPAFAIEWKDDPYSTDLSYKFREALQKQTALDPDLPKLNMIFWSIPFSVGRMHRPNMVEARVAEDIVASLPPPGTRTVLVIPSVTSPTRRVLRALVQGNPAIGRRLVAITGDGLSVNTFFRDRDFAWPVRSLPVPVVMFTHADPFGFDTPGHGPTPPRGYELQAPAEGATRSSTEDIQLFTLLARVVATCAFPDGANELATRSNRLDERLKALNPPFFDASGNRLSGTGEHVAVLRPVFPGESPANRPHLDAILEIYSNHSDTTGWKLLHTQPLSHAVGEYVE